MEKDKQTQIEKLNEVMDIHKVENMQSGDHKEI